ncbi:N-acetylmuramoyl-L-alanine amidase [Campylobacter fetus subsp. testudinum]|uniref:N-acetylmuramoyl-L-alanine amidase family protein n=1 Tax=Campylobacter fetus TaxID=196 RepID=UPI00081894AD|nr:N-acetylmuramoyl-L-alanine amidase [Campylobacter fetus]AVK81471.1 N-acetylmuramoyl-L-alanine amidase [Campylobacter fetus subsp. testudinum]MPB72507.1 N-acetylmuramoyl-L-alanine amidase [Campylobacter fetus]MPB77209.1 N-acetylmuramoyl-L-alanine amidase [Campylobacter fetus]OCR86852.1 N-acetylmuramoyl-L-alanine amidase [Campylobacter fetus subsp. testudinum]OCS03276.1 N-acetylmuramoyl-L-alanine amidase [Campylobacter fetus subsp. testudinum]
MGKIVRVFLLFILSVFAFGADFSSWLGEFDTKFHSSTKQEQLRIYHDLKGAYVHSILNDNKDLKIQTLLRLVDGSKKLGLDYKVYESELKNYENKDIISYAQTKESAKKTQKQTANTNIIPKVETPTKKIESKEQKTENEVQKSSSKESKDEVKRSLRVLKFSSDDDSFVLSLNRDADEKEIKTFELNTKELYKRIYDINAILTTPFKKPTQKISDDIRVAQFDKDTVRVVFYSDKKQNINTKFENKSIIFFIKEDASKKPAADLDVKSQTQKTNDKTTQKSKTQISAAAKNSKKEDDKKSQIETKNTIKNIPRNKTIVLDAGHGGKDAGAVGSRTLYEKNVVLKVALKAGKILKNRGYKVYYTRDKDKFIGLRNRTSFANDKMADLFISIHANAAPNSKKASEMQGIETFFLSPTRSERSMRAANLENKSDTDEMNYFTKISFLNFLNREKIIASNKLAIDIQTNLLSSVRTNYNVSDGGVREAPFWVLVGALMPAVLIETGYITHPKEGKLLANDAYADKLAEGIANGIDDYFAKNR